MEFRSIAISEFELLTQHKSDTPDRGLLLYRSVLARLL